MTKDISTAPNTSPTERAEAALGIAPATGGGVRLSQTSAPPDSKDAEMWRLRFENTRLKRENEMLRGSLIKTPSELHRISAVVASWGFGSLSPKASQEGDK